MCKLQYRHEMTVIRKLYLASLILLFSPISALQTGNSNKTACESSDVTIDFSFNLGNDTFLDRSWYKHSSVAANKIARVDSTGSWTVEPQYSGRVALSGLGGITLYNATKSDSGSYLFVILTKISSEDGTATTTVNVYDIANTSCVPILEKRNSDSFTCKIPDACPGKDNIQAIWDDGSFDVFSCPSTTVTRKYSCCAKGDSFTNCYNGFLCTEIECKRTDAVFKSDGILFIILVICISYIIMVILIIDLIFWIKNSMVSIFMQFLKISRQCLHILYLVLLIIVVVCEIFIIIIIIIGCQSQITLGVGLGFGLFIITVSCIFLVVFIKTEVIIRHKDTIQNPRINTNVKITAFLRQIFISDVEWIGPNGNTLSTEEKYIIEQYNSNTGESSLTITNVSWDDNGSYICQSKNGCKLAKDTIHILCDKTKWNNNTGRDFFGSVESEKGTLGICPGTTMLGMLQL